MVPSVIVLLFFGAAFLVLVEGWCVNVKLKTDYDVECKKWWAKGMEYTKSDWARRGCVDLIKDKCPYMIDITTTVSRECDNSRYEVWTTEVKTALKSDADTWMIYYEEKKKPICWDDDGRVSACNYWWTVAQLEKLKNKHKELCINRILAHCRNSITFVEEYDLCEVQRCIKGYSVKRVVYEKPKNGQASYDRYGPIGN